VIRHQLPAYSPLAAGRLLGAALRAVIDPSRGRADMTALLAARYEAPEVLLTSSGTHALQCALTLASSAAPWANRPVALPAYTCYDVATAAVGAGVPVAFYDIDPASLSPDAEGVRRVLADGAGVVVAGSLYGFPLDWTWLRRECEAADALLVEDAAQGLASGWAGRGGGTFGDLTVLSFGRGKGWTGGGGGALLVRSGFAERTTGVASSASLVAPSVAGNVRSFSLSLVQWAFGRPGLFRVPASIPSLGLGETRYKEPTVPAAMNAVAASTAYAHGDLARAEAEKRRANAGRWLEVLKSTGLLRGPAYRLPELMEGGSCGYLRLPLLTAGAGPERDSLVREGRAFGLAMAYPNRLPELPQLRASLAPSAPDPTPGAAEIANHLFTLPTHSLVEERDMRCAADLLQAAAARSL